MKRLMFILAVAVLAGSVIAQVKETLNVNLVEVPVTVVDSSGNPVRGLTAANFEITDNGTKRQITAFDKIDFSSAEAVTAISPLNPSARRQFMLLFDLTNSSPNAIGRSARRCSTCGSAIGAVPDIGSFRKLRPIRL